MKAETQKQPVSEILKSKPHFEVLDGLRGVAALSIVVFHFMEMVYLDYSKNFTGHGFLAVDFFFCLSGFVTGYAYDSRIEKMGVREFFKSRLIRLHPLVILGSVLGLTGFLMDPFGGHSELYSTGKLTLMFLASILLIPYPVMPDRGFGLFGLNTPSWSLFWEYSANIVYAFILYRLSRRLLLILILISAAAICFVAYHSGSVIGGWDRDSFWDGFARISYSFLAGLFVYRSKWMIRSKSGFAFLSALLLGTFIMPFSKWNWITEPIVVIVGYPLLIALGAGASLTERVKHICVLSGKISYPLYMTHIWAIWTFGSYYNLHKPDTGTLAYVIIIGTLLLVGVAYLAMILYDIPLRSYLTKIRKQV